MRGADVVLLCCPAEELQTRDVLVLADELRAFKEGAETEESIVLVGTKSDLKDLKDDETDRRGGAVAAELGLQHFLECSSASTSTSTSTSTSAFTSTSTFTNSVRELLQKVIDISNNTIGRFKQNTCTRYSFLAGKEKEVTVTLESSQDNLTPLRGMNLINLVHSLAFNKVEGSPETNRIA